MIISFDMPFVFHPGTNQVENARALKVSLEYLIALNRIFLAGHAVPDLYRSGVVYGRTQVWDTIPALYAKRYGDCKSLSAALIAQMRQAGLVADPVFRWVREPDGTVNYHILVQTPHGFEDPSKRLGMTQNENSYFQRNKG